jgi:hypothetical protein
MIIIWIPIAPIFITLFAEIVSLPPPPPMPMPLQTVFTRALINNFGLILFWVLKGMVMAVMMVLAPVAALSRLPLWMVRILLLTGVLFSALWLLAAIPCWMQGGLPRLLGRLRFQCDSTHLDLPLVLTLGGITRLIVLWTATPRPLLLRLLASV